MKNLIIITIFVFAVTPTHAGIGKWFKKEFKPTITGERKLKIKPYVRFRHKGKSLTIKPYVKISHKGKAVKIRDYIRISHKQNTILKVKIKDIISLAAGAK